MKNWLAKFGNPGIAISDVSCAAAWPCSRQDGEPEAALPVDPAPVVAAVLDALPAFEADGSDDSERGGDDEFNDMCEVPASEAAEMMGWDTYDDDYVGS